MKILKNPRFAACVMVVVLVASLFGGTYRTLNKLVREVEQTVYMSGKPDATDTIDFQLYVCVDAIMGVITVANRYDDLSEATTRLRTARSNLIEATTLLDRNIAYADMNATYLALAMVAETVVSEPQDLAEWNAYGDEYRSATLFLRRLVDEYNARVDNFPDNLLGVKPHRFEISNWSV